MPTVLLFLVLLAITFVAIFYFLRPTKTETAVQRHLDDIKDSRIAEPESGTILKRERFSSNPALNDIIKQLPGAFATLKLIRHSGLELSVGAVMGSSLFIFLVSSWLASLILSGVFLPVFIGLLLASVPYVILYFKRESRFNRCDKVLPEAVDLMARALRAGHALPAVLEMVGNEIGEPISSEFRRLHEETALGLPLRDATLNLVDRLPRDDVRFLATAILLQKETGGNLAAILDKTGFVARERARLRGQLRIYTAQGRLTGWILCVMPFCMFGLLSFLNWNTEKLLITDNWGKTAVDVGLVLMVLGILTIRKIMDIKV